MRKSLLAWAGVAAPVVWLGGALVMSHAQRGFMDRLGWDVWPSGLALGPYGWGQILVFLVFAVLYIAFATYAVSCATWSGLARWGSRVVLLGAVITPLLAFRTDPPNSDVTWHGALHAVGYVALVSSMLVAFIALYPGLIRRAKGRWRWAPLPLALIPFAWLAPNAEVTGNYLFFAVPFTVFAALALVLREGTRAQETSAAVGSGSGGQRTGHRRLRDVHRQTPATHMGKPKQ